MKKQITQSGAVLAASSVALLPFHSLAADSTAAGSSLPRGSSPALGSQKITGLSLKPAGYSQGNSFASVHSATVTGPLSSQSISASVYFNTNGPKYMSAYVSGLGWFCRDSNGGWAQAVTKSTNSKTGSSSYLGCASSAFQFNNCTSGKVGNNCSNMNVSIVQGLNLSGLGGTKVYISENDNVAYHSTDDLVTTIASGAVTSRATAPLEIFAASAGAEQPIARVNNVSGESYTYWGSRSPVKVTQTLYTNPNTGESVRTFFDAIGFPSKIVDEKAGEYAVLSWGSSSVTFHYYKTNGTFLMSQTKTLNAQGQFAAQEQTATGGNRFAGGDLDDLATFAQGAAISQVSNFTTALAKGGGALLLGGLAVSSAPLMLAGGTALVVGLMAKPVLNSLTNQSIEVRDTQSGTVNIGNLQNKINNSIDAASNWVKGLFNPKAGNDASSQGAVDFTGAYSSSAGLVTSVPAPVQQLAIAPTPTTGPGVTAITNATGTSPAPATPTTPTTPVTPVTPVTPTAPATTTGTGTSPSTLPSDPGLCHEDVLMETLNKEKQISAALVPSMATNFIAAMCSLNTQKTSLYQSSIVKLQQCGSTPLIQSSITMYQNSIADVASSSRALGCAP